LLLLIVALSLGLLAMSLSDMKLWRLFIPAILIVAYGILLFYLVNHKLLQMPDISKAPHLIVFIIPAALYYVTPLRKWFNSDSHEKINEALRSGLVTITGYTDKPSVYTWKNLRPLFYSIIDNDASLSTKTKLAYFNGLLWTSFADSAAIACGYCVASIILCFLNVDGSGLSLVLFTIIGIFSIIANKISTDKHIAIGKEQLEVVDLHYKSQIEARLNELERR
jgi:hypothetical protein